MLLALPEDASVELKRARRAQRKNKKAKIGAVALNGGRPIDKNGTTTIAEETPLTTIYVKEKEISVGGSFSNDSQQFDAMNVSTSPPKTRGLFDSRHNSPTPERPEKVRRTPEKELNQVRLAKNGESSSRQIRQEARPLYKRQLTDKYPAEKRKCNQQQLRMA